MATSRISLLPVILLLLGAITLTEGLRTAMGAKKCCYKFAAGPPKQDVVSYVKTSQRCSNRALLLTTTSGKKVCGRPDDAWVRDAINFLDNKKILGDKTPLQ